MNSPKLLDIDEMRLEELLDKIHAAQADLISEESNLVRWIIAALLCVITHAVSPSWLLLVFVWLLGSKIVFDMVCLGACAFAYWRAIRAFRAATRAIAKRMAATSYN